MGKTDEEGGGVFEGLVWGPGSGQLQQGRREGQREWRVGFGVWGGRRMEQMERAPGRPFLQPRSAAPSQEKQP